MKRLLQTTFAAIMAVGFAASAQAAAVVGTPAPEFILTDSNGKAHALSDFAGKTVVLEWVNHGCPYVKKHYNSGNMQSLQKSATGDGVVWLTIASSEPGAQGHNAAKAWTGEIAKHGMKSSAVLLDEDGKVGRAYGAKATPHMFVIDGGGTLRYNGAIDDKPTTNVADVKGATNYVSLALGAIKEGKPVAKETTKAYGCSIKYARDS